MSAPKLQRSGIAGSWRMGEWSFTSDAHEEPENRRGPGYEWCAHHHDKGEFFHRTLRECVEHARNLDRRAP